MSTTTMIIIIAVAAIVALVLLARDGGPRVTHIETKREHKDEDDE
jgi:hypothetical protein